MKIGSRNNDLGFTLVELMVVVAIIGVLSMVAIPNFKKYQAKAKTSEAKVQLSAIYMAEISFMADADTYASCLLDMGFTAPSNNYYFIGFKDISTVADTNGVTCAQGAGYEFAAAKGAGGLKADSDTFLPTAKASFPGIMGSEFYAGAGGIISAANNTAALADQWSVDHDKTISHERPGY